MASTFPPRVGTVFADRYQLREALGTGGVGQVFRAWDLQAQRLVALKVYSPAAVSGATWAAYAAVVEAALPLRHPDLVLPQGLPKALGAAPLGVMESLVGEDLATMRARLGRVPWRRAVEIAVRVAEILQVVQEATGVAHRDLKATNVFVTEAGAVKLLDYGVAEFDAQSADRTRVDSALGIVDYKAPEQLETNVGGHHADVFSLAVLVFEMICGERPFTGGSYFVVARKILLEATPSVASIAPDAGVPAALEAVLQRALAKRPADRYADMQAMQRALGDVLGPAPRGGRAQAAPSRQPARSAAARPDDRHPAPPAAPRGGPRTASRPGNLRQTVPTGTSAVVVAAAGEGASEVESISETVVAKAPVAPPARRAAADETVVYAPANLPTSRAAGDLRVPHPAPLQRGAAPSRVQAHAQRDAPSQPPRAERTLILSDDAGPPRAEATLILPEDGAPPPERTMILADEPEARPEGTLQLPESTLQLAGDGAGRGWTLQRTLIAINVACGVLILLGLLVLVFGGDQTVMVQEK